MRLETLFNEIVAKNPKQIAVEFFDEDITKCELTYNEVASLACKVEETIRAHMLMEKNNLITTTQETNFCENYSQNNNSITVQNQKVNLQEPQYEKHSLPACTKVLSQTIKKPVIGLYVDPSLCFPSLVLGVLQSGCSFTPMDPNATKDSKKYFLKSANVDAVLTFSSHLRNVEELAGISEGIPIDWYNRNSIQLVLCILAQSVKDNSYFPEELAYTVHTSGTTANPKIVRVPHKSILTNILHLIRVFKVTPTDKVGMVSPPTFDPSIVEMFVALSSGATLVIPMPSLKQKPSLLCDVFFKLAKLTVIFPTPCLMSRFSVDELKEYAFCRNSPLRLVVLGGEACPSGKTIKSWIHPDIIASLIETRFPKFYNIYGITEVSSWATLYEIPLERIICESDDAIPLGLPLCSTKLEISDDNCSCVIQSNYSLTDLMNTDESRDLSSSVTLTLNESQNKVEVTGMLKIGGSERACVVLNTDDNPTETLAHSSMLCSGDIVTIKVEDVELSSGQQTFTVNGDTDGVQIFYLGRKDGQIKRHCKRMNLFILKQKLEKSKFSSAVHLVNLTNNKFQEFPDKKSPQKMLLPKLIAFVVLNKLDGAKEKFMNQIRETLEPFLIPDETMFVDCLPLTAHGKVNEKQLLNMYLSNVELLNGNSLKTVSFEFLTNLLFQNWTKVLPVEQESKTDSDKLCINENVNNSNFISAGGDSFAAVKLVSMLEAKLPNINIEHLLQVILNESFQDVANHLHNALTVVQDGGQPAEVYSKTNLQPHSSKRKSVVQNLTLLKKKRSDNRDMSILQLLSISRGGKVRCHPTENNLTPFVELKTTFKHKLELKETWVYDTLKCVDASPLVILSNEEEGLASCVIIGSHSFYIACLNISNGNVIWKTQLNGRIESSACLTPCGDYVVVGCYDGNIYALDVKNGLVSWSFHTGAEVKSSPCTGLSRSIVYASSHDGFVYCLNIKEKLLVWKHHCGGGSVFSSLCLSGNKEIFANLFVGTLSGNVLSLSAQHGKLNWEKKLSKPIFSSPVASESGLFVATVDWNLYKLDLNTGNVIWSYRTMAPIFSSPVIMPTSTQHTVCIGSHDGHLYCLDEATGSLMWKFPSTEDQSGQPVYATPFPICWNSSVNLIVSASTDGLISIIDVENGQLVAQKRLPGHVFSSPVFIGRDLTRDRIVEMSDETSIGNVFIGCRNNLLYSLSLCLSKT